jgi:hypothetical protein
MSWGPRVAQYIRNTAFTLLENPGLTMAEIPALLSNRDFRAGIVPNVRNPQVQIFWDNYEHLLRSPAHQFERADSTLNKLDEFLTQPIVANIVGQARSTVDFRRFMDEGKIVLVPLGLGRLGAPVVSLLGSLLVLQLLNAALSRENSPVRRQFNLYADEYQRFATPAFDTLLTEARKYGVATTIAHQVRAQLDSKTRAAALNAGSIVVFAVHGEDAEELAKQFDRTPPEPPPSGSAAIKVVTQSPVQFLLRNGHRDEDVRENCQFLLQPIANQINLLGENDLYHWVRSEEPKQWRWFMDHGVYYVSKRTFQRGLNEINAYLVSMMEGRIRPGSKEHIEAALDCLVTLRAYVGIAPCEYFPEVEPIQLIFEKNDSGSLVEYLFPQGTRDALFRLLKGFMEGKNVVEMGPTTWMDFARAREDFWRTNILYRPPRGPEEDVRSYLAHDRAGVEAIRCLGYLTRMLNLGLILAREPITVDSGQWEPTYHQPRPYGDVEAEIANALVSQPQFHATCRIPQGGASAGFHIRTPSFVLLDESHRFANLESIRDRSRREYCKPRFEVEASMVERLHHSPDGRPQRSRLTELEDETQ